MSKYAKLSAHLSSLKTGEWVAQFWEIESILGFALPASARAYPAWWSNQGPPGHSQTLGWKSAGWKTSALDLLGEKVTFVKDTHQPAPAPAGASSARALHPRGLSIAEAKAGLAVYFSIPEEAIEITIKG